MPKSKSEALKKKIAGKMHRVGGMGGLVLKEGEKKRGFGYTYKIDEAFKHGKRIGGLQTKKRGGREEKITFKDGHAVQGHDVRYLEKD